MSGWYRTGTVSVTNGNANVVGTGTLWLTQAAVGDIFYGPDLVAYEITSITDDTHLAIKQIGGTAAYAGSTLSAQAYAILRNFTSTTNAALALNLADMINKWHLTLDELLSWLTSSGTVSLTNPATSAEVSVKTPSQVQAEWIGSLSKAITTADVTLTSTEAGNAFITATGALTGNRSIILPTAQGHQIAFTNSTTGAYTLTVKTAAGTGVVVPQGARVMLFCDGTNVVNSFTSSAITGVGALTSGSIASGFGSINIGTSTLAAGNTTITGTLSATSDLTLNNGVLTSPTHVYLKAASTGHIYAQPNGGGTVLDVFSTGVAVTGTLSATGTLRSTGNVGVSVAPTANIGLRCIPTFDTSVSQYASVFQAVGNSSATTAIYGVEVQADTAAASFTCAAVTAIRIRTGSKGSGSTITTQTGLLIDNQTNGTTNYAIKTGTGLVSFGDSLSVTGQTTTNAFAANLVTNSAATYSVLSTDHTIIQTTAASVYTLPAASSNTGRILKIVTQFAGTVTSASSNVVPLAGGSAGTAILAATAGKFAVLQSNGTNWVIVSAN